MSAHKPLVWLPACHRNLDLSDPGGYTVLADRYAAAVCELGLQPVLFPLASAGDVAGLLPLVDGVLLTGSPSNVEATHFGASALETDLLDPRRDRLTMALVPAALAPDGLVEGVRVASARAFAYGVQWPPGVAPRPHPVLPADVAGLRRRLPRALPPAPGAVPMSPRDALDAWRVP